ncbi:MAG: bifunctional phosphopantothenoylcysteine decarboxylase/phosphopantothenate--cysteine ligase CoaBC [Nostocoides sp.]
MTDRVVLGVAGGIAAYKACSLVRLFTEGGADVTVVPTAAALEFVGAPTWAALTGKPVWTSVFEDITEVPHVRLGQNADLVMVAPATADLLARAAGGHADDLLTNVLLTARCPVAMAPAMHTEMWEHPATQANVATLSQRGVHIIPPASGRLTGSDSGAGRLPEPEELYAVARRILHEARGAATGGAVDPPQPLAGARVVVSAGGTREPLDPVRYLGNRSSGKQGFAIAAAAAAAGAQVTLVAANTQLEEPTGVQVVHVETAQELGEIMQANADDADVLVMAAAVADFRPDTVAATKIKKSSTDDSAPTITLVRNPDILAGLVAGRGAAARPIIVGFAAETGDGERSVLDLGADKLARKGCDLLVVNEVGFTKTFGADDNTVHILRAGSSEVVQIGPATKDDVARGLIDIIGADLA